MSQNQAPVGPEKLYYSTRNAVSQKFGLPKTLIAYIFKYPISTFSPQLYYKLYFCCKYFFTKFRALPCTSAEMDKKPGLKKNSKRLIKLFTLTYDNQSICLYFPLHFITRINYKIFIFNQFTVSKTKDDFVTRLFKGVKFINLKTISLTDQSITLNQFQILTKNARFVKLRRVIVKDVDGSKVRYSSLLTSVPHLYAQTMNYRCLVLVKRNYIAKR